MSNIVVLRNKVLEKCPASWDAELVYLWVNFGERSEVYTTEQYRYFWDSRDTVDRPK
jgi:hypothetical protein